MAKIRIGRAGQPCRHCGTSVIDIQTGHTQPKPGSYYFYTGYFRCPHCNAMYMDESRKVKLNSINMKRSPAEKLASRPKELLKAVQVPTEAVATPENMELYDCYFDGSCGPVNPGGVARYGWVIKDGTGEAVAFESRRIGVGEGMTNNVAEYAGLYFLLRFIRRNNLSGHFKIKGDSLLVVKMSTRQWGRGNPHKDAKHLLAWLLPIHQMLAEPIEGQKYTIEWIEREKNQEADALSNLTYDRVPPEVESTESHHEPFPIHYS